MRLAVCLLFVLFGWSSLESGLYWNMMRRRVVLGLAEPEVANRFALWSLAGALSVVSVVTMTGVGLAGRNPLEDPLNMLVTGISGLVASAALVLAFLPPERYLAWVRGESA